MSRKFFYDPQLGRFSQADTVTPGGVQGLDRYAGMANNPLRYVDPTGHTAVSEDGVCIGKDCEGEGRGNGGGIPTKPPTNPTESEMIEYIQSFGIMLEGVWTGALLANLWEALFTYIGYRNLTVWLNGKTATLVWGGGRTCPEGMDGCYGGLTSYTKVTFSATNMVNPVINILHELGHLIDNLWDNYFTYELQNTTFTLDSEYLAGWDDDVYNSLPSSGHKNVRNTALISKTAGGGDAWQQRGGTANFEDWADIFANAMIGNIDLTTDLGAQMWSFYNVMENHVMGSVP